jgi:NADPH2:quinone reductase
MDWGGRFLVIGFAGGDMPKLALNLVLLRSYDVLGVYWGAWTRRDPQGHRANMAQILDWCVQGKLSSHVHRVYPLAEGPAALKDIAARKVMGKAILRP